MVTTVLSNKDYKMLQENDQWRALVLSNVVLSYVKYSGKKVNQAIFKNSKMRCVFFKGTVFTKCIFTGADFDNSSFIDCKFLDCKFEQATATKCCFQGSEIRPCRVDGITSAFDTRNFYLNGCDITDTIIDTDNTGIVIQSPILFPARRECIDYTNPLKSVLDLINPSDKKIIVEYSRSSASTTRSGATIYNYNNNYSNTTFPTTSTYASRTKAVIRFSNPAFFGCEETE